MAQRTTDHIPLLDNARSRLIANGPVTCEADNILAEHEIPVLPDVLAECLERETHRVLGRAEEANVTYRRAAYLQGIERIAEATLQRGNCQKSD